MRDQRRERMKQFPGVLNRTSPQEAGEIILIAPLEDLSEKFFLGGEVVEKSRFRDIRRRCDVRQRRTGISMGPEQFDGLIEDRSRLSSLPTLGRPGLRRSPAQTS